MQKLLQWPLKWRKPRAEDYVAGVDVAEEPAAAPTSVAVDREFLVSLAAALEYAPRIEDTQCLPLTDELARTIAERLRTIAQHMA